MSRKLCWGDADVRCPFYLEGSGRRIVCEGHIDGTTNTLCFRLLKDKDRHMGIHCAGPYERCEIYKLTLKNRYGE